MEMREREREREGVESNRTPYTASFLTTIAIFTTHRENIYIYIIPYFRMSNIATHTYICHTHLLFRCLQKTTAKNITEVQQSHQIFHKDMVIHTIYFQEELDR